MTKNSSEKGRALEYIFCETFKSDWCTTPVHFTPESERQQSRDEVKYSELPDQQRQYFKSHSERIVSYIESEYFSKVNSLSLDRFHDFKGIEGDPTDVQLKSDEVVLNISLKHNNDSLKHQRPATVFDHLGVIDKEGEERYRTRIQEISTDFYALAMTMDSNMSLFNEVKSKDPNMIDEKLYRLVTKEYFGLLDKFGHLPEVAQNYFFFLIGSVDYLQIKVLKKDVKISKFVDIDPPNSMASTRLSNSTFDLEFDNGFVFNIRLHSASSKMESCSTGSCSLKFDTKFSKTPSHMLIDELLD